MSKGHIGAIQNYCFSKRLSIKYKQMSGEFSGLGSNQQGHIGEYEIATVLHEASATLTGHGRSQQLEVDTSQEPQYINGVPCLYGDVFYSAHASGETVCILEPTAAEALEITETDEVRCTFYGMRFDRGSDGHVLRNPRLELIVMPADVRRLPRILAIIHDVYRDTYATVTDEQGMSQGQLEAAAHIARIMPLAEKVEAEQEFYKEVA